MFCAQTLTQARTPTPGHVPLVKLTGAAAGIPPPTCVCCGGSSSLGTRPQRVEKPLVLRDGTYPGTSRGGHCLHTRYISTCLAFQRQGKATEVPRTALPHGRCAGACAHISRSRHHLRQERRRLHLAGARARARSAHSPAVPAAAPCIRRRKASQCMLLVNMAGVHVYTLLAHA